MSSNVAVTAAANSEKKEQCKLLLESAERLENEGKLDEALTAIQKIIEMAPSYSNKVYSTKGRLLFKLGNFKDSIVAYCTALNLEHRKKDEKEIACGLESPLDKYMALNWKDISEFTDKELWASLRLNFVIGGKKLGLSQRLYLVGHLLLIHSYFQDAKIVLEAVAEIVSKGESVFHYVYIDLGVVYRQLYEDEEKCLRCYEKAKLAAQSTYQQFQGWQWTGATCCSLGRYEEGERHFQVALEVTNNLPSNGKDMCQIMILSKRASILEMKGEVQKAIKQYEKILRRPIMSEMLEHKIEIRFNLGKALESAGDYRKACEQYRKALDLSGQFPNIAEGPSLEALTDVLITIGEYTEAAKFAKKLIDFSIKTQNRSSEANACSLLGSIYTSLGDYKNAIIYNERSWKIRLEEGDKKGAGQTLINLGMAYKKAGDNRKALSCFTDQLKIARECDDEEGEMKAHKCLSDTYEELGDLSKANSEYDLYEALALKRTYDPERKALLLLSSGQRLQLNAGGIGDYVEVIRLYQEALHAAQTMGLKKLESVILNNLGHAYLNRTKPNIPESTRSFQQGRRISREQGDAPMEANQIYGLARANVASGKLIEAEGEMKKCIDLYENINKKLRDEESLKISIQDVQKQVYKLLEFVQIKLKKHEDALLTAERGRARVIADVMQLNSSTDRSPTTLEDIRSCADNSPVLFYSLNRELVFIWIIHCDGGISFRQHHLSLQSVEGTSFQDQIEQLCEEMSREMHVTMLMEAQSPTEPNSPASLASDTFCSAPIGQAQRHTLHSTETLSVGDVSLDPVVSPDGADYLVEEISRMYRAIDESLCTRDLPHRNRTPPNQSGGDNMYNALIGSVQDLLVDNPEIVIVPEGSLYKLPFSALRDQDGRYLSESVRIRVVPSLTTLQIIAKRRMIVKCKEVLIAGDPNVGNVQVDDGKAHLVTRLPAANRECKMIGQMLHVTPLTGDEATKTAVLKRLPHAHLIHLAAHGHPDTGEIFLAPETHSADSQIHDVMLQMSEVQAVKLRPQLVVLSCCDSGRGEIRTEGVIGIARSFLAAGARAVLVSLWSIDDEGTYHFMRSFYRYLLSGMTAGEAQHQAMEDMRKSKEFHKEKYWAPFVLLGDDVRLDFDSYNS